MPRSPERQPQDIGVSTSARTDKIEGQIRTIIEMCEVAQEKPGEMLASIWQSEEFKALSLPEQESLRTKYATEEESAPIKTPEAPQAAPETATPDTKAGRPKTWLFVDYVLQQDPETGAFLIYENKSKYNERKGRHVKNRRPMLTAIRLPEELSDRLSREPELGNSIIKFCSRIRNQLDEPGERGGLALLFDRRKGERGEGWQPKWKYSLDDEEKPADRKSKPRENRIDIAAGGWDAESKTVNDSDRMPPEIYELAEAFWKKKERGEAGPADRYWTKPVWRTWYGKAIQRKREDIISDELARHEFGPASAETETAGRRIPATERTAAAMTPERPAAAVEAAPKAVKRETEHPEEYYAAESAPIIEKLLPAISGLYPGKDREARLSIIKHVAKSTLDILNDRYARANDAAALDRIWQVGFVESLSERIAREFERREAAERFFEQHTFFDAASVEVVTENSFVLHLDRLGAKNSDEALEHAARALVFDALEGTDAGGVEGRLTALVTETLRRLENKKADAVEYDAARGRLTIKDLDAWQRLIRRKAAPKNG